MAEGRDERAAGVGDFGVDVAGDAGGDPGDAVRTRTGQLRGRRGVEDAGRVPSRGLTPVTAHRRGDTWCPAAGRPGTTWEKTGVRR
jgi:hypothetical protein